MDYSTYTKILTDEHLMETVSHGSNDYPFRFYLDDLSLFDFHCVEWHWHTEFEFSFIKQENVVVSVGDQRFHLPEGSGVFINSKTLHSFHSEKDALIPNIVYAPSFLAPENSRIYQKYVLPVITSGPDFQIFSPDIPWQHKILDLLRQIIAAHDSDPVNELLISALLQSLWHLLYQNIKIGQLREKSDSAGAQARLQLMMQHIHAHYALPLTLEGIAGSANVSKSTARNLFHQYLQTTPVNYLNNYRLKEAARMLLSTEYTIYAIAQKSGFDSSAYFCRIFKKHYHITPSQYRIAKTPQHS